MKKKLIILLVLFASLPLLLFSTFSLISNNNELQKNANQISMYNVKAVQYEINMLINQNFDTLNVLAQNDLFHEGAVNTDAIKSLLIASSKVYPETILNYVDTTGQQKARSDNLALANIADRSYFKQVLQTGQSAVSEVLANKSNGHNAITLCYPILDAKNKVIGTVNGVLDLSSLSDYVNKLSKDGNKAFISDRIGKVLAHSDPAYLNKDLSKVNYIQQGLQGHSGTEVVTENGKKMFVSYAYDSQTGWVISNEQSYDAVMAQSTKIKTQSIWILVITLLLAVGVGYYFSERITKPIIQLTALTKKAADGDLTIRVSFRDKNEIGQLAHSFNTMIQNIRQIIQQVGSSSESVASSAEQLTERASQTRNATEQVALISEEVAVGTENQVQTVHGSARSVQEMSEGVQQIAANSQSVSSSAVQASEKTEQGNLAVQAAIQQMNSIHQTVNGMAETITELGTRSQEIELIVGTITDIASQTNLLALNAAIEAARAGVHGRGFGVVADEIRKLAEQSFQSAQNIVQLIRAIQGDSTKAVRSMDVGIQEVALGLNAVNMAGEAFQQIQDSIRGVASQIQEVSAAAQQFSANTVLVVKSFENVLQVSDRTAEGTQNISAAAEEQLAAMEEIASSARFLSNMADELQSLVRKFNI